MIVNEYNLDFKLKIHQNCISIATRQKETGIQQTSFWNPIPTTQNIPSLIRNRLTHSSIAHSILKSIHLQLNQLEYQLHGKMGESQQNQMEIKTIQSDFLQLNDRVHEKLMHYREIAPQIATDLKVYLELVEDVVVCEKKGVQIQTSFDKQKFIYQSSIDSSVQSYKPFLFSKISCFRFPFLKKLSIIGREMPSIQGLSRMFFPSLEKLGIYDNHLTTIKQLRKFCFPLSELLIEQNYINQRSCLSSMWSKKLRRKDCWHDFSWIWKMEGKKLQEICMVWNKPKDSEKNLILKKYPLLHIGQMYEEE